VEETEEAEGRTRLAGRSLVLVEVEEALRLRDVVAEGIVACRDVFSWPRWGRDSMQTRDLNHACWPKRVRLLQL
jgi:hypothetical protein